MFEKLGEIKENYTYLFNDTIEDVYLMFMWNIICVYIVI